MVDDLLQNAPITVATAAKTIGGLDGVYNCGYGPEMWFGKLMSSLQKPLTMIMYDAYCPCVCRKSKAPRFDEIFNSSYRLQINSNSAARP
jgi:hypothetical protein